MIETCTNCTGKIGIMEKAFVYNGKIVCQPCYNKFNNISTRPPKVKSKKSVHLGLCFFVAAIILMLIIAINQVDHIQQNPAKAIPAQLPSIKKHVNHSKIIEEEPIPTLDKSPAMQQQRLALIKKMIVKEGVFCKVECLATIPKVWVTSRFYSLDYKNKNLLISVVYAYYFDGSNWLDGVQLKDCYSGRVVGDYSEVYGGLKMR